MSYARVNWNSTTTYVSADNLNVMDKGIKDLDTNMGDVAALKTSAKTIVPAINEINNNLTDLIAINELNIGTFTANTLKTVDVSIPAKSLIIGYQGTVGNNDIKQATPLCASDGRIVGVCALSSVTQDIFIRFMTFK